jgi:hypothetical protein
LIIAVLKQAGKIDSLRQRLIKVVIGGRRASRHDLSTVVGIKSSGQDALDEVRIAVLTSSSVARSKCESTGGGD